MYRIKFKIGQTKAKRAWVLLIKSIEITLRIINEMKKIEFESMNIKHTQIYNLVFLFCKRRRQIERAWNKPATKPHKQLNTVQEKKCRAKIECKIYMQVKRNVCHTNQGIYKRIICALYKVHSSWLLVFFFSFIRFKLAVCCSTLLPVYLPFDVHFVFINIRCHCNTTNWTQLNIP